jgi:mRNA interferase RelE/StbE
VADCRLRLKRGVKKELGKLNLEDHERVVSRIGGLASDPRPYGCEKLSGEEKYRVRQGDYRIVYGIDDAQSIVTVVKIGHRRDVYR